MRKWVWKGSFSWEGEEGRNPRKCFFFNIPHSHRNKPIIPFGERESSEVSLVVEAKKKKKRRGNPLLSTWSHIQYLFNSFLLKKGLKCWIQGFYACKTSAGECSLSSQELLSPTPKTRAEVDVFTAWWFREIWGYFDQKLHFVKLQV